MGMQINLGLVVSFSITDQIQIIRFNLHINWDRYSY